MLEFNIRNQEISRIDNFSPAEKSVEYLIAKFNFKTADWNETAKTATFKNLKTKKEYDKIIEDNQCKVPWEVLDGNSDIEVSVFGVNGAYTITTDVACFKLNRTLSGGSASTEPTPSTYAQYVAHVSEERQKAESAAKTAEEFAKKAEDASEGKSIDVDDTLSEESTNPVQNKVITAEVIALRERNAELEETIEKLQIKVTTEPSPYHHITDSANFKVLDFGMEGITEQETTSGKNRIDPNTEQRVSNSVYYHRDEPLLCKAGQAYVYKIYNVPSNITITGIYAYVDGTDKKASFQTDTLTFTFDEDTYAYIRVVFSGSGTDLSFLDDCWCQLETGSVATEYEPHTGNQPSPNPEYEQPITLAGEYNKETGRYEHKCCVGNKNFWNNEIINDRANALANTPWSGYNGYPVYVGAGNPFVVSFAGAIKAGLNFHAAICLGTSNITKWLYTNANGQSQTPYKYTGVAVSDYIWISITATKEDLFAQYIGNTLQIELNSAETDYLPHASQPFTITSDRPLTMWDNLVKVDGKWYWDYKSRLYEVTGKENFQVGDSVYTTGSSTNQYFDVTDKVKDASWTQNGFCTCLYFNGGVWNKTDAIGFTYNYEQIHMRLPNTLLGVSDDATSSEKRAAYVAYLQEKYANGNPIKLLYETKEHELVPLPDEEQELLRNLETYYGVTNVYNEQGCPISLTYISDPKLYVDQKLLQIQQAII